MTIAYISAPFYADCDFPLIKELRAQGHRIIHFILITPQLLKSTLIEIDKQYPHDGIFKANIYEEIAKYSAYINEDTYVINRTYPNTAVLKRIISSFQLYKFIRSFHCDYVWTSIPFGLNDLILYRFQKIILTVHDPFPHSGEHSLQRLTIEKIAFKLCNKFVLLNNKQIKRFTETYHINSSSVLINKLGTYDCIKIFTPPTKKRSTPPYILFYGRISPYKGIEYLLEAFLQIHSLHPELHLVIAGNGNYYFDKSQYESLDFIEFKNYHISMEETAQLFHEAQFIVCPYLDATQSGVIMTAFTMNKAVIATKVGALEECVANNYTGLIVPPKNTQELAKAISNLYSNSKLLQEFEGNIAKENSQGKYSWKVIAQKYIKFLS